MIVVDSVHVFFFFFIYSDSVKRQQFASLDLSYWFKYICLKWHKHCCQVLCLWNRLKLHLMFDIFIAHNSALSLSPPACYISSLHVSLEVMAVLSLINQTCWYTPCTDAIYHSSVTLLQMNAQMSWFKVLQLTQALYTAEHTYISVCTIYI